MKLLLLPLLSLFIASASGQHNVLCGGTFDLSTLARGETVDIFSHKGVVDGGSVYQPVPYTCNHTIVRGASCRRWTFSCPVFNLNSTMRGRKKRRRCVGDILTIKGRGPNRNLGSGCGRRRPRRLRNKRNRFLDLSYSVVNAKVEGVEHGFQCQVTCTRSRKPALVSKPTEAPDQCFCGLPRRQRRIVGGVSTEKNEYPWQAGLTRVYPNGTFHQKPFCGGTLINDRYVITAAHCLQSYIVPSPDRLGILLGEHDLTTDAEADHVEATVEKFHFHDSYNDYTTDYDYGWVKLATPINFTDHPHIRPACPPCRPVANLEGQDGVLTGWGTTIGGNLNSQANVLLEATQKIISKDDCTTGSGGLSLYYAASDITDRMFCATAEGKDSCQGDSGGPIVSKCKPETPFDVYYLTGITSWGFGCAVYPGVYADVEDVWESYFLPEFNRTGAVWWCDDPTEAGQPRR